MVCVVPLACVYLFQRVVYDAEAVGASHWTASAGATAANNTCRRAVEFCCVLRRLSCVSVHCVQPHMWGVGRGAIVGHWTVPAGAAAAVGCWTSVLQRSCVA